MNGILNPAVLVLGATGRVGAGVVSALLEAGCPVIAVARGADRLSRLTQTHADEPGLEVMQASVADDDAAAELARRLQGRPLRAIVACLAGPLERGRLLDRAVICLQRVLEENLLPHLAAARHLLPLLADSHRRESAGGQGSVAAHYILVGATGAEQGWAGYGEISIAAAAQTMLAKVLHGEAATLGVRLQMLSLDHPLCDPLDVNRNCARWPTALSVGRRVVAMLISHGKVAPVVRFSAPWAPPPAETLYPLRSGDSLRVFPDLPG